MDLTSGDSIFKAFRFHIDKVAVTTASALWIVKLKLVEAHGCYLRTGRYMETGARQLASNTVQVVRWKTGVWAMSGTPSKAHHW